MKKGQTVSIRDKMEKLAQTKDLGQIKLARIMANSRAIRPNLTIRSQAKPSAVYGSTSVRSAARHSPKRPGRSFIAKKHSGVD
jgi:hypothetical protein